MNQGIHKKLFLLTMSLQFICTVILYVISFFWLSRIYPYFSNGIGIAYWLYRILLYQTIYLSFVFIIYLILLSYSCITVKWDKTKFLSVQTIILFSLCGIILNVPHVGSGLWLSFRAIERDDTITNRCYIYIINGLIGADSKYLSTEYKKWRENFVNHTFNKEGHVTSYLCENMSIPMIVSATILIFVVVLCCVCIYLTCKHLVSNTNIRVNVSFNDPLTVSFSSMNRRNGYT